MTTMSENGFRDPNLTVERRVADLLARMTTEEKIGQLNQPAGGWRFYIKEGGQVRLSDEFRTIVTGHGLGAIYGLFRVDPWTGITLETGLTPTEGAAVANEIQHYVIENTRLGIPLLISEECPHGHMAIGATVFPTSILQASTWDPALIEKMARVIARETRAEGGNIGFGPILDVVWDPRWSRVEETYGEDPWLNTRMGVAMVRGLQGAALTDHDAVLSTLKHFGAYGTTEGGRNCAPAYVGERLLREVHLAPFRACVEAGAQSLMSSYNEIDGIPGTSNPWLLTKILRGEWGFKSFVVSDGYAIDLLCKNHHVAENLGIAAAQALRAGVDINLCDEAFLYLPDALKNGRITMADIDQAVSRILRAKFLLGLFENPYVDVGRVAGVVGTPENREVAREVARRGIVLLKNVDNVLPLKKDIRSIAVIGPNADTIYNQLGDYTTPQHEGDIVTVLRGIREKIPAATQVRYAKGCHVRHPSRDGFREAIEVAKQSDVVVAVVGGSSTRDFAQKFMRTGAAIPGTGSKIIDADCGEGFDRSDLNLAGVQNELLKELHATGVPLVVVLIQGRPHTIPWIAENAAAILCAWYPGCEGGAAIADVLFGDCNPGGKLPISIPKSTGQVPLFYYHKSWARGNYVEGDSKPLFPFGYGLSYTTFEYSSLALSAKSIKSVESVTVTVNVTNTGKVAGDEVVQMYIRDEVGSVTRPVKQLRGFERIRLEPGATRSVKFVITPEMLSFLGLDMRPVVEPGEFTVMIGGSSESVVSASFAVENQDPVTAP
ncbi:MAG: glycoside hydrolase family 3 C-terminal domain-containing protein [Methylacidiphilales bacterium]|nr:glycoside hydrolase family 3 C-terminal domain-containing protein [Candidatus Methylacidiphilales bacterium]